MYVKRVFEESLAIIFLSSVLTTAMAAKPHEKVVAIPPKHAAQKALKAKPVSVPLQAGEMVTAGGKTFLLYPAVKKALKKTSLPYAAMLELCAWESTCDPTKVNSHTHARGLMQFKNTSLYELLYKKGVEAGYPVQASWIQRHVHKNKRGLNVFTYAPVNEVARKKIEALALDPAFNVAMYAVDTRPKVAAYEAWLGTGRKITAGELIALNNWGLNGLKLFAQQAWKPEGCRMLARDFFKAHAGIYGDVSHNYTALKNEDGRWLTVGQSYAKMFQFSGYEELKIAAR